MKKIMKPALLMLALVLAFTAARAEKWRAADGNAVRFRVLFDLLIDACGEEPSPSNASSTELVISQIREESADDGDIAQAIADHWQSNVLDSGYRMFVYRGEEKAEALERSGLDFSGKHAFVVLGYCLRDGQMTDELVGRCDAAAAAARSFPDAILITTGGATGSNNPDGHTEAGEMKRYLVNTCGIDESRIFTDTEAMTTQENAVNTFRILREQGISTYTIVTSDYHQLWGQILFNAVAAIYEKSVGYEVRMIGNYNYPARPDAGRTSGCGTGLSQLSGLIRNGLDTGT